MWGSSEIEIAAGCRHTFVSANEIMENQTNSKLPETGYFWIRFSVLKHYAVTTLRVVKSGSPRLRITKNG